MPRRARIRVRGLPLHVYQRGHCKKPCFAETNDYLLYLGLFHESAELYPTAVHAYVLMTNHVHFLVTPTEPQNISSLMKRVNERYSQHFNRKYGRSGAAWEGRFKMSLVDTEAYLLRCHRYIELNPVRAAMVAHPAHYEWSSYRANAYGEGSDVIQPHERYLAMGSTEDERLAAYRAFVGEGESDAELSAIRAATSGSRPLASDAFLSTLPAELRASPRPPGRPRRLKRDGGA